MAVLIYKTSKTARARAKAAAAAGKEMGQTNASSGSRNSTRKRSIASHEDGMLPGRPGKRRTAKRVRKTCSVDECTNRAQKGGVCYRHGAKVKLCSKVGCKIKHRKEGCASVMGHRRNDAAMKGAQIK